MGKTIENIHKIFNFIYNVTVNLCEIEKAMVWHLNIEMNFYGKL